MSSCHSTTPRYSRGRTRHADRRPRRQSQLRQDHALQRAHRPAAEGRQLPRRHRREEDGQVQAARRHHRRRDRPARHVQPDQPLAGRADRDGGAARAAAGHAGAGRRRRRRRREQPPAQPVPRQPAHRARPADGRRAEHDGRRRAARAARVRRDAGERARRAGRAGGGAQAQGHRRAEGRRPQGGRRADAGLAAARPDARGADARRRGAGDPALRHRQLADAAAQGVPGDRRARCSSATAPSDMAEIAGQEPVASLLDHATSRACSSSASTRCRPTSRRTTTGSKASPAGPCRTCDVPVDPAPLTVAGRPLDYATPRKPHLTQKLDAILIHKVWGLLVFAAIMAVAVRLRLLGRRPDDGRDRSRPSAGSASSSPAGWARARSATW